MDIQLSTLDEIRSVVAETLGIQDRLGSLTASTPLFGGMPEFDSLAVVELAVALESRFGIDIEQDELTGDVFETIGTLAAFVDRNRRPI